MCTSYTEQINEQWGQGDPYERVLKELRRQAIDPQRATWEDVAAFDQFHAGGVGAVAELAKRVALKPGMRVLDAGASVGGPARYLAATFGCSVDCVDLTRSFHQAGQKLTELVHLQHLVRHHLADVTDLAFEDETFDVAWLQHISLNVLDKPRFYAELFRVLRPGGVLAMHEWLLGEAGHPVFPAPWSEDGRLSFLITADEQRALLNGAGFVDFEMEDATGPAAAWFEKVAARAASAEAHRADPTTDQRRRHFIATMTNAALNLRQHRTAIFLATPRKPAAHGNHQ
jgi:cyclopropane fatty-acyl-phospholipid synthase-like methyltransferase